MEVRPGGVQGAGHGPVRGGGAAAVVASEEQAGVPGVPEPGKAGLPLAQRQKTNGHVERMNRKLRFDEKVSYGWRSRKSIVRWVLLRISRHVPDPKPGAQRQGSGAGESG